MTGASEPSRLLILVVDDHPDTADVLALLLRRCGHDAVAAYDGEQALAFLGQRVPAAVVLDLWMPRTDGRAVLRHLRAEPRHARVPVLVCSADTSPEALREAMALGATEFILKGSLAWRELCDRVAAHARRPTP